MRQADLEAAQHLLSSFSCPFVGVKFLYDYGLCERNAARVAEGWRRNQGEGDSMIGVGGGGASMGGGG
jgi:hypothetical protein